MLIEEFSFANVKWNNSINMRLWFLTNQLFNRFILTIIFYLFFKIYFYSSNIKIVYNTQAVCNWLAVKTAHLLFIIPTKDIWTKKIPTKTTSVWDWAANLPEAPTSKWKECTAEAATGSHRSSALPSTICQPADRQTGLSAELRCHRIFQLPKFSLTPQWSQNSLRQLIIFPLKTKQFWLPKLGCKEQLNVHSYQQFNITEKNALLQLFILRVRTLFS